MSVVFGPGISRQPAEGVLLADTNAADLAPFVVQAVDSQAGNLMEFRDPSGTLLSAVDINGAIGGAAGLAGAVILAPASAGRNTIQPGADNVEGIILKGHSPTQAADMLQVQNSTGTPIVRIDSPLGLLVLSPTKSVPTLAALGKPGGSSGLAIFKGLTAAGNETGELFVNDSGNLFWDAADSGVTTTSPTGSIQAGLADNTHNASRGFLKFTAQDTPGFNFREFLRGSTNGSVATIGFLGASPVVQQAGASAAGIAAVTDANAKAALTALQAALAAYGLVTSPA